MWSSKCLASLTKHKMFRVHPCCSICHVSALVFYGQITFHCNGCTTFYLSIQINKSIHQIMDFWIFSTFWLLRIMLPWTFMYKILCGHIFSSFLSIPSSGMASSCGNSLLNVLRTSRLFQSDCTILHSHHQCMSVSISLYPCQLLHLCIFFILAILVGVKWCSIVVFMCISLMVNGIEHLFFFFLFF